MTFERVISILALIGIGGLITTGAQMLWERKKSALAKKHEFKEVRYKCIILLMYSCLDFEKHNIMLQQHGRSFSSVSDLIDELKTEWHNMMLFASDEVIKQMYLFIESPSYELFRKTVLAMRKDLWGGKLSSDIAKIGFPKRS